MKSQSILRQRKNLALETTEKYNLGDRDREKGELHGYSGMRRIIIEWAEFVRLQSRFQTSQTKFSTQLKPHTKKSLASG